MEVDSPSVPSGFCTRKKSFQPFIVEVKFAQNIFVLSIFGRDLLGLFYN